MSNLITFAKSVIRDNPGFAVVALSLDAVVGIIAGLVAFIIYNMVDFSVTSALVLTVSALLATGGIILGAYGYLSIRGMVPDFDEDEPMEGEACRTCGQVWTGTL